MVNVCFVGLYEECNYGDPIIAHCTEWLYKKYKSFGSIQRLSLDYSQKHCHPSFFHHIRNKAFRFVKPNSCINYGLYYDSISYFQKNLKNVNLIVAVGGGLIKFKAQHLHEHLSALIEVAQEKGIDIVLNAVGVEGYDKDDERCQFLRKRLNYSCIKHISVRDDINTLINYYLDKNHTSTISKVSDPAVWAAEAYNIKREENTGTIGIGIARGNLFKDYNLNFSEEQVLGLYLDIIVQLHSIKKKIILFTNGLASDNKQLFKVLNLLQMKGLNIDYAIPSSPQSLVEIISSFDAIIATRLHSCIVAYSLNIPAIGLVWNDKLSFWGNNIGVPDNYITIENFTSPYIIDKLEKAVLRYYNQVKRTYFRNTIIKDIKEYI